MWAQCLGTFHANVVRCITHAHTKPRCKSLSQQTTMSYARPNTIATTHCSNTTLSSYPVSPGVGPVPWRLPRQRNCLTTHTQTQNHVTIILTTVPTNNHGLCTPKHHRHHAQSSFNVVMLFSFARYGPSALVPSTPMLFADTHTHTRTHKTASSSLSQHHQQTMHVQTPSPPRTAQIQRCHVAQRRQMWAQCLGAFHANVVR